jgi:hypothetical protein
MKTGTTPFTIEEIAEQFDRIEPHFMRPATRKMNRWVEDETGESDLVEVDEEYLTPKRGSLGQVYSFKSWLNRIFTIDAAQRFTAKDAQFGKTAKAYLLDEFRVFKTYSEGGEVYNPNNGKTYVDQEALIRRWLSGVFGFFKWNGQVVQVNPAELFAIQFMPEKNRNLNITEIRIINTVEDGVSNWALDRFNYYLGALAGVKGTFAASRPDYDTAVVKNHFLTYDFKQWKFAMEKTIIKDDLLEYLYDLGTVVNFGWNANLSCEYSSISTTNDIREIRREFAEREGFNTDTQYFMPYSNGGFVCLWKFSAEEAKSVVEKPTEELQGLTKYLLNLAKIQTKDQFRSLSDVKSDMKRNQFFAEGTIKKTKFIEQYFIPQCKRLGFVIQPKVVRVDGKNTRVLQVSKKGYGRNK